MRGIKNKNLDVVYKKNEKLMKNKKNSVPESSNGYKKINNNKNMKEIEDNLADQNFSGGLNKNKKINKVINDYAKDVFSELHLKTHFQATTILANNTKQDILNKNKNKNGSRISPIRADSEIRDVEKENKHHSKILNFFILFY